jgi:hypothetical protein
MHMCQRTGWSAEKCYAECTRYLYSRDAQAFEEGDPKADENIRSIER